MKNVTTIVKFKISPKEVSGEFEFLPQASKEDQHDEIQECIIEEVKDNIEYVLFYEIDCKNLNEDEIYNVIKNLFDEENKEDRYLVKAFLSHVKLKNIDIQTSKFIYDAFIEDRS